MRTLLAAAVMVASACVAHWRSPAVTGGDAWLAGIVGGILVGTLMAPHKTG